MKKVMLYHWVIVIVEYLTVYLIASFVKWELSNPFQWIIEIPTYTGGTRFMILFYFLAWHIIQILFIYKSLKPKT